MNPRGWPLWAGVIAHVLLSLLHGVAHLTIPVAVRDWQYGYAAVVIVIAPLVGAGLVAKGRTGTGAWLLLDQFQGSSARSAIESST